MHFTDWPDEQLVRLDAEGRVMHDAFINGVKEVSFMYSRRVSYGSKLIGVLTGGFHTEWYSKGDHVVVKRRLNAAMGGGARTYDT